MSTQQDTDDDRSITLEQQAKFAVGDDASDKEVVEVPDEPVATTVDDFGVEVDYRDPETCIDKPTASGLDADDRPEDDDTIGPSEQKPLVADVEEGQTDLEGDEVHGEPMFETEGDEADESDETPGEESSDRDDSESDDATDTDAEHPDTGEDTDESTEADEQSDDAADECDEHADDEATETTDDKTDDAETDVDLLDSGIIDRAGVSHRTLREALTDTEYDLHLTSIPGIGEEIAEQLRAVQCTDTALLAVGWASDHYHAHVVDALSELPANHRERAITEIKALYDEVLAEVVEPEAVWVDDATPGPDADTDADTDSDVDDPLAA